MSGGRHADWLARYHDGELGLLSRWRARRRIEGDADARAAQQDLERLGSLLREIDTSEDAPDLWPAIRTALTAAPAPSPARHARRPRFELRWIGAGLAAAAAGIALAIGLSSEDASAQGAIRWLDGRGRPLMVLQDDAEATVIWVPEAASEGGAAEGFRVAV
jgi:hypothetical protein